ncbi:hypothetical protein [Flavisolibacter nicotianae]|uniref:hypothetical protein n=1 Tax=Flavisolibacter nicotianae TaxID=2364882 RepID=UPI0013C5170D|nr:hypothetical protein [Flavisolibacter nicotianae]
MGKFDKTVLSISDDTGLLALVNAERYISFVCSDWSLEQLQQRFTEQAEAKTILIWRTGGEGFHKVAILPESTKRDATKQFSGEIEVTSGCLHLTNYEDLSMAAQFEDETLPAAHNSDLLISLPNALYNVTVRQLNYRDDAIEEEEKIDFEICLTAQF